MGRAVHNYNPRSVCICCACYRARTYHTSTVHNFPSRACSAVQCTQTVYTAAPVTYITRGRNSQGTTFEFSRECEEQPFYHFKLLASVFAPFDFICRKLRDFNIIFVMEQKWVLLDFGDLGLDIVETQFVEFPKDARHKLNNENLMDVKDDPVTYKNMKKKTGKNKGQQTATRYQASIIKFGGKSDHTYTVSGPSIWTTYDPPCVIIG